MFSLRRSASGFYDYYAEQYIATIVQALVFIAAGAVLALRTPGCVRLIGGSYLEPRRSDFEPFGPQEPKHE